MAVVVLDFEGGVGGAAVALGAVSGFTVAPTVDGGGAAVYTTTAGQFFHGAVGVKLTAASTTVSNHAYGTVTGLNCTDIAVDACFKWPALNTADFQQIRVVDTASAVICSFLLNSAGKFRITGSGGVVLTPLWTAATPTGTWCRLKLWVDPGTTTTTGQIQAAVYNAETGVQIGTTLALTNANLGTANIDQVRLGHIGGYVGDYYLDLAGYSVNQGGLMPDLGGNTAPTVAITSGAVQNVAAASTVLLTGTASDTDGTIASQSWAGTRWQAAAAPASMTSSITNPFTPNASYTAGTAPSLDVITYLATDNGGLSASTTTEIRVPGSGEVKTLAGWGGSGVAVTNVGSAASEGATLGTGTIGTPDDTKYVEFPAATGTAQARRFRLAPSVALTGGTMTHRLALSVAGTVGVNVRLYQGSTVKATWAISGVTTTPTDYPTTLTSTQAGTITDWGNLWVEYEEV